MDLQTVTNWLNAIDMGVLTIFMLLAITDSILTHIRISRIEKRLGRDDQQSQEPS